jgi:hypothetical protein
VGSSLEIDIFDLKMIVESGLEILICIEIPRTPLELLLTGLVFLAEFLAMGRSNSEGARRMQNKISRPLLKLIFKSKMSISNWQINFKIS